MSVALLRCFWNSAIICSRVGVAAAAVSGSAGLALVSPEAGVGCADEASSIRVISSSEIPSTDAALAASRCVRSAAFGTASTPVALPTAMLTSAFMPGLSRPSRLLMRTSTGNIVTLEMVSACGSILITSPMNGRFGNASTVTRASMP